MKDIRILIVDDDRNNLYPLVEQLGEFNYRAEHDPRKACRLLKTEQFDIIVTDYRMDHVNGLELLMEAKNAGAYEFGILISAYADKELLEKFINNVLINRVMEKPIQISSLIETLKEAVIECRKIKAEQERAEQVKSVYSEMLRTMNKSIGMIIGEDAGFRGIYKTAESFASSKGSVLITGETGVGKELFASLIHEKSSRRESPFIKVNCSEINTNLFESEFFGHVEGAFSGAIRDKPSKFEMANKGTIFIDEIGDLPSECQAKLLRVLQEGEVSRVGSDKPIAVDFRLVTATNKNLEEMIDRG